MRGCAPAQLSEAKYILEFRFPFRPAGQWLLYRPFRNPKSERGAAGSKGPRLSSTFISAERRETKQNFVSDVEFWHFRLVRLTIFWHTANRTVVLSYFIRASAVGFALYSAQSGTPRVMWIRLQGRESILYVFKE